MSFKIKQTHNNDTETLCLEFGDKTIELEGITSAELDIDALTTQGELNTDLTTDHLKKKALIALIKSADKTELESIFSQPGFLSNKSIQKALVEAIKEIDNTDDKQKALIALIKNTDNSQLKKIFEKPNFLSNCNQALSNIITEKNIDIDIVLKRKTIKALHKIKVNGSQEKIAKIMIAALDVNDAETKGEAIYFFKEYHKEVDENLITFLVNTSELDLGFKKDLYTNKVKMSALNGLLEKFNNQENIDDCLKKAKKYLVLIGHADFNVKEPGIDLFYKVPTNIKELTQQKKDGKSALDSIKDIVKDHQDSKQKQFVLELFFGKIKPAASKNIPATIEVNDIEKFIKFYQGKLKKLLEEEKIDYSDKDSVAFYKEYIKADFINTIPNNQKPGGGLVSLMSWGYSNSWFDSGNYSCFYLKSTTKENNDQFLTKILKIKKEAFFKGTSNRKENERPCDKDAIERIVKEYASCSSESSKREYRQAFYQVLEDLKCIESAKKDWSYKIKTIELKGNLTIPCSKDQLHLLVHAKIANSRYGYSQNELAETIKKTKPERLTSEINNYCEKHQQSLLNRKKENLNILCIKISTSDNIGLFAGGLGGATRYVLNSFVFSPLRKSANSASYCKPSLPSFSITKPDGFTLTDPKGASQ